MICQIMSTREDDGEFWDVGSSLRDGGRRGCPDGIGGKGRWNLLSMDMFVSCESKVFGDKLGWGLVGLLVSFFLDRQPGMGPCRRSQGLFAFLRSLMNASVCEIWVSLVGWQ